MSTPSASKTAGRAARAPRGKQIEEILDFVVRRRYVIGGVFLLVALASALYAFTRPMSYTTAAVVTVDFTRIPGGETLAPQAGTPFMRSDRTIGTELFILENSRAIDERVDARLAGGGGTRPTGSVSFVAVPRVPSALQIVVTSSDPQAAAALANAYAEEYVRQTQTDSRAYMTGSLEFLQEQEERLRGELTTAENQLQAFMERNRTGGGAPAGLSAGNRVAGFEAERDNARIELQVQQATLAAIQRELGSAQPRLSQRTASPVDREIESVRQELAQLEAQRQEMLSFEAGRVARGLPARDPNTRSDFRLVSQQIQSKQQELTRLSQRFSSEIAAAGGAGAGEAYISRLQEQLSETQIAISGLQARIGSAQQRIGAAEGEIARAPGQTTGITRLERNRAYAEQMYGFVNERLRELQLAEASQSGYARVLRAAPVPSFPTGSDPVRNLSFGLGIGLLLALGLAFARDRFDTRVYKPEHLAERGLYVLEAVPDLKPLVKEEFDGAEETEWEGRRVSTNLVTLLSPLAPPTETYRHLRTSIQFSRPGVLIETILITSAGAGEGKSTTAANLAITMAQAGRRTLLIDADLRRPRQHELFGMAPDTGLAQILAVGDSTPEALAQWMEMFRTSEAQPLYVLPTGAVATLEAGEGTQEGRWRIDNPAELLGSPRMRETLRQFRKMFDVVIIDTPPVLAATDAVLLSTQADATVLVTSSGKTKGGDIEQALDHLHDVGAHVVGGVLNRFTLTDAFGYAYSYGHYSRYGPYSVYGYGKVKGKGKRTQGSASSPSESRSA